MATEKGYMRLSDALAEYWLEKQLDLSTATIRDYSTTFTRLSAFLGDPIFADITADDIRRFLAHVQKNTAWARKPWSTTGSPCLPFGHGLKSNMI